MDDKTERTVIVCITLLILAGIAAMYTTCQKTDEHRAECIEQGKTPEDCKRLFNSTNSNW